MFRSVLSEVNLYIKDRVTSLTGEELYDLKKGFYEKSTEYMGHANNLTGITELLINMYVTHFLDANRLRYNINRNCSIVGANGHENEIDIAVIDDNDKVRIGFSIKREQGSAGWKKHELDCEFCQRYRREFGKDNIVQDLYRLDNIKRGEHGDFKSMTIIFEEVNQATIDRMNRIQKSSKHSHSYIVLQGNNMPLWDQLLKLILPEE